MIKNILILTLLILAKNSYARNQIIGAGSSTVYPFITTVAEEFGRNTEYRTPIIEATGTGGGFKLFCKGIGKKHTDISNASREIKESEIKLCESNGIKDILEIKIGYDGIALANSIDASNFNFTLNDIFLSVAKQVPINGKIVENPYEYWNQINPKLPNSKIIIYGPPPTSGTRDAFAELVLQKTCIKIPEFIAKYPNKKTRKKICSSVREDGKYIEAGENDNVIIQKLTNNKEAIGIFGFSFLEENYDKVKSSKINNNNATFENISKGKYPISRSLFVYVKQEHFSIIPSLKPFIKELIREETIQADGYLIDKGLIPLNRKEYQKIKQKTLNAL